MAATTHITFEQLVKLPQVHAYLTAFRRASGLALQLLPTRRPASRADRERNRIAGATATLGEPEQQGFSLCADVPPARLSGIGRFDRSNERVRVRFQMAIVPVRVAGVHLADWCCGPVICWSPVRSRPGLKGRLPAEAAEAAERLASYWGLTPISGEQFRAAEELLRLFSRHIAQLLAGESERRGLACRCGEPRWVARAKGLLAQHALPIPAVALATGFRCRMEFVAAFRAHVGMSPAEFQSQRPARAAASAEPN